MDGIRRAALIGDFCGAGKCALNAAIPILAAAGVEAYPAPARLLSAWPQAEPDAVGEDRTGELPGIARRWKSLGLKFDAVACSFSGGAEAVTAFAEEFRGKDCFFLVDPMLERLDGSQWGEATRLCAGADVVVPDVGEAACLLGEKKREGPYDRRYVEYLLRNLCGMGPQRAVVKGVWFSPNLLGAAGLDIASGSVSYAFSPRVRGDFSGSGEVFSAALLSGLLGGHKLNTAMQLAVDFTADCMRRTREAGGDTRFGLKLEACLPKLIRDLGLAEF